LLDVVLLVWVQLRYVSFKGLVDLHVATHDKVAEHYVHEEYAESLAVETIYPAAMTGKHISEIFYIVGSLEARCEKSCEWTD